MQKKCKFLIILFLTICNVVFSLEIKNPYQDINWKKDKQYRVNLHTHTKCSDGQLSLSEVVNRYREAGYTILAITDHNIITFPWEQFDKSGNYENRNPREIDMLAVQGCEFSSHHHLGSYFTDAGPCVDIESSLNNIREKDGIAVLFHPGRYNYSDEWYIDLYTRYPFIVGIEVHNQGNRCPMDQILWDRILTRLMPDRPVWGFGNDDAHLPEHIGLSWNVFILKNLTVDELDTAMRKGIFYFSYKPEKTSDKMPPLIKSILISRVLVQNGEIRIYVKSKDANAIEWISDGKVVATGEVVNLNKIKKDTGTYIRARLIGEGGYTYTQPFGIIDK
ncbi:MAG: PHP domain-containing protein [bacterium]|nr:PHP domain-containing protein [bacterium]